VSQFEIVLAPANRRTFPSGFGKPSLGVEAAGFCGSTLALRRPSSTKLDLGRVRLTTNRIDGRRHGLAKPTKRDSQKGCENRSREKENQQILDRTPRSSVWISCQGAGGAGSKIRGTG
jgi:hypothetical protein